MSTMPSAAADRRVQGDQTDIREQLFNGGEVGPIVRVQLPAEAITRLHGILLDIDLHLFRADGPTAGATTGPKRFYREVLGPWLERHPALAGAEVRASGRGLHVIIRLAEPVCFETDGDRDRWAGIVQVVQAVLPVDPDQPGLTALTRSVGSTNGRNGREVRCLRPGAPVPVAEVLRLHGQMASAPFRTVLRVLAGGDRAAPCPICRAEGSSLSALDRVGRCYSSCGTVGLAKLYDAYLEPRKSRGKEAADVVD